MPRSVIGGLAVALVLLFVVSSAVTAEEGGEGPEILIEEMRYDLGEVFEAEKYSHAFAIKNVGSADLLIEKVQPS